MHYIFNPVYAGVDTFTSELMTTVSTEDFDTFSDELDSVKYRLMELPFNEVTYRLIGDLNLHQAVYSRDAMTIFKVGDFLLTRVSDTISLVSFGFDDNSTAEKMSSTIKMITKKQGIVWPSHIPDDIASLVVIKDALVSQELAKVEDLSGLLKD